MRRAVSLNIVAGAAIAMFAATPAFAGIAPTPAPALGIGIGALAILGLGYRTLKRRIDRRD